jgi:acetone carboxylase gamma subunit
MLSLLVFVDNKSNFKLNSNVYNMDTRQKYNVTYSGFSIHDGTLLHSKSQYTTVKHSRQLSEHT